MWAYFIVCVISEEEYYVCDISKGTTDWLYLIIISHRKITKILEERWQGKQEWDEKF